MLLDNNYSSTGCEMAKSEKLFGTHSWVKKFILFELKMRQTFIYKYKNYFTILLTGK